MLFVRSPFNVTPTPGRPQNPPKAQQSIPLSLEETKKKKKKNPKVTTPVTAVTPPVNPTVSERATWRKTGSKL